MTRTISHSLLQRDARNTLGFFVLVSMGLSGVNILLSLCLVMAYFNLSNKPAPSMVQLEGGRTIRVEALDSKERAPALVQSFTRDSATMLFSASGQLPSANPTEKPTPDAGIRIENSDRRVSSLAYLASAGLAEDFRSTFLKKLAGATPPDVFNGNLQVVYNIQNILEPQKLEDGRWKVVVIGALVAYSASNPEGAAVSFNKEFFIRAVLPPAINETSTPLEKQVAKVRAAGLEIYDIRDFVRANS